MLAAWAMTALSAGAILEIALAAAFRSRVGRRRSSAITGSAASVAGLGSVVAADSRRIGSAGAAQR